MIVLIILIAAHIIVWGINKRYRKSLLILSIFTVIVSLIWMIFLDAELNGLTYGADESFYLQAMHLTYTGFSRASQFPAAGFVRLGAWALAYAPLDDATWIRFINIIVYSLTINILYLFSFSLFESWYQKKLPNSLHHQLKTKYLIYFAIFACNGIIIWTVIRVLKETTLLLVYILALVTVYYVIYARKLLVKVALLLVAIGLAWILGSLRNGAEFLPLFLFAGISMYRYIFALSRKESTWSVWKRIFSLIGVGLVLAAFFYFLWPIFFKRLQYFTIYESIYGNYFSSDLSDMLKASGAAGYILGFFRFILGPGPLRALQQVLSQDVFLVSTRTGDILIFIGALQWWIALASMLLIIPLLKWFRSMSSAFSINTMLLIAAFLHVVVYVVLYAGTGDTRHRAVLYLLAAPFIICQNLIYGLKKPHKNIPRQETLRNDNALTQVK